MKLRLDPNSTQPLHQQAEELLRTMIQQEEYKKGKLMPNEVELSKELNISRNTLRQAINRLVFEGLLIRKKDYGDYLRRVRRLAKIYDACGYNYAKHIFGK